MNKPTSQQVAAYLNTINLIGQMIKSVPTGIAAGHLYASVMGMMSLEQFERIVGHLVAAEVVTRAPSHLLTWVGPK